VSHRDAELVAAVRAALRSVADPVQAAPMQAYMKSSMPFLGVKKHERSRVLRPVLSAHRLADRDIWEVTIRALWDDASFREERYAALDLARSRPYMQYAHSPLSLSLYDHLIVTGAWWDYVDDVAIRLVGPVLREAPVRTVPTIRRWARDPDRWRRRAAVICQVGAGDHLDADLLRETILANIDDPDFFLRKGIGWALRQHARTDPAWVRAFVATHSSRLSTLARREAMRVLSHA
jgi:3-methyladenine DNA glycosylase AlkD